ncbi:MAG: helicase c2 [Clostridiales bacterium]|jgi:Rad3-related DNA helicase|nr:helicase c2 [Clostridiales bacterium]
MINHIKISVRNLVEFILRGGDIDNRRGAYSDKDAMQEGSRIHRKIQKQMGSSYTAEVPLKIEIPIDEFVISLEGRADGIIIKEDEVTIDEIKGVYADLSYIEEPVFVHKAQAMCYAYIYGMQNDLQNISVQMTYCNIETEVIKRFHESFEFDQLDMWFRSVISEYAKWARFSYQSKKIRNRSIKGIEFPFEYRSGQKELAVSVYKTIKRRKTLFIQAPTGVGKTMSTIFPTVKAMGEELGDKLFYLTAKTITRTVAEEGFEILRSKGLQIKTATITAKDKLCICEEKECNPDACPYAKGHYDRINEAVFAVVSQNDNITRDILIQYANEYTVCPFEMCLDVTYWVDVIICDYNYVFDPNVFLRRYFSDGVKGDYIFLVDEAHNLVERARQMYSAELFKDNFLEIKRVVSSQSKSLASVIEKCNKHLLAMKKLCNNYVVMHDIDNFIIELLRLMTQMEKFLEEEKIFDERKKVLEFYLNVRNFLKIYELVDKSYVIYVENNSDTGFMIKLLCVDTSTNLRACLNKGNATVFFSATLLPIKYYKELLSNNVEDYAVYVHSPFDIKKRLLMIASDVSSKFTRRNREEYNKIYEYIKQVVQIKSGNYIVFFPSYSFMQDVYEVAIENGLDHEMELLKQKSSMLEEERELFLGNFKPNRDTSLVAFCVLGGVFSEGIDLKLDRLIGTIIVGTGLPMVCNERELLKQYYEERGENGFDFAYLYPGMNKVLQAAGRVIRTDFDQGIILLLDERFNGKQYKNLFPKEWEEYKVVNQLTLEPTVEEFWG